MCFEIIVIYWSSSLEICFLFLQFNFLSIYIFVPLQNLCWLVFCIFQVLLGDVGAGKSSLVLRFVRGQFIEFQVCT